MNTKKCLNCGDDFTYIRSDKKHCSLACRIIYAKKLKMQGTNAVIKTKKPRANSDKFDWSDYNNEIIM